MIQHQQTMANSDSTSNQTIGHTIIPSLSLYGSAAQIANETIERDHGCIDFTNHTVPTVMHIQFYLITGLGSSISLIGILLNLFLLYLFLCRAGLRSKENIYLTIICLLDIAVELSYLITFSIGVYSEYTRHLVLRRIWHSYVLYVFTVAQVSMTAGSYVIVAAAVERYFVHGRGIKTKHDPVGHIKRTALISVALATAVFIKISVFFELRVVHNLNCTGKIDEFWIDQSDLMHLYYYRVIWTFWIRQIFHTILPFTLLIVIQIHLWYRNRYSGVRSLLLVARKQREQRMQSRETRAAKQMLIAVVTSYLIVNAFNVFVSVWEFFDIDGLRELEDGAVYTIISDVSSILTVANGAFRLPIYYAVNRHIRKQVRAICLEVSSKPASPKTPGASTALMKPNRQSTYDYGDDDQMPMYAAILTARLTQTKDAATNTSIIQNGDVMRLSRSFTMNDNESLLFIDDCFSDSLEAPNGLCICNQHSLCNNITNNNNNQQYNAYRANKTRTPRKQQCLSTSSEELNRLIGCDEDNHFILYTTTV